MLRRFSRLVRAPLVLAMLLLLLSAQHALGQIVNGVTPCSCNEGVSEAQTRNECSSEANELLSSADADAAMYTCGGNVCNIMSFPEVDASTASLDTDHCASLRAINSNFAVAEQYDIFDSYTPVPVGMCRDADRHVPERVFSCHDCFSGCTGVSPYWVFEEGTSSFVFNKAAGRADMTGVLVNTGNPAARMQLSVAFEDYVGGDLPDGLEPHLDECGVTEAHSSWRYFVKTSGSASVLAGNGNPLPPGLAFSLQGRVTNNAAQFGYYRAHLKGVSGDDELLGGSTWVALSEISNNAADRDACRLVFDEAADSRSYVIDFNFGLEPKCAFQCDPTGRIGGDPHLVGFFGQKFNVLGDDGHVYNLISTPHLQYNARFSATPFMHKDKHATLISEMGIMVGEQLVRVYFADLENSDELTVEVNGESIAFDAVAGQRTVLLSEDGQEMVIRTGPLSVIVLTRDFHFVVDGKLHRFRHLDDGVRMTNWSLGEGAVHGLLGQTALPSHVAKPGSAEATHEVVVDDKWPSYLDGKLADYDVPSGDIFGTDSAFNLFEGAM